MSTPLQTANKHRTGVLWLRDDLRLNDNPAVLAAAESCQRLLCVFCMDDRWFAPGPFGIPAMGAHRRTFLQNSLIDLDTQLRGLGQRLIVLKGQPLEQITALIATHRIDAMFTNRHPGLYERRDQDELSHRFPMLAMRSFDGSTLFSASQIRELGRLPSTFSAFRRIVEKWPNVPAIQDVHTLPPPILDTTGEQGLSSPAQSLMPNFAGGSAAAERHLCEYFSSAAPQSYKETRNALDDWPSSTKFSPWLARGCMSPRQIIHELRQHEARNGANESTYWIEFELLWREYFHWYAHEHDHRLFSFRGINGKRPLTSFYTQRFAAWTQGTTPWPLVNAIMQQLRNTGYISNRARQIAASCLIYDLELDWRCGAQWFEHQLIDFDVAANWGNWQYIAGVGADPRGGRHFNIDKQTQQYDPNGDYIQRWAGSSHALPLHAVDAADWPIEN